MEARLFVTAGLFLFLGRMPFVGEIMGNIFNATMDKILGAGVRPLCPPAVELEPIVRTKLEKYGGAIAPTDQALTEIVVKRPGAAPGPEAAAADARTGKTHTRKPPQPTTLELVLEQFRLYELRPLSIGKFCVEWLAHQPELPPDQQIPRGEALKRIREGLARQDQVSFAARLDRFIACYWIAAELGWTAAWKLRYAAIRELLPLFGRNAATEEYCLRPDKAEATRAVGQDAGRTPYGDRGPRRGPQASAAEGRSHAWALRQVGGRATRDAPHCGPAERPGRSARMDPAGAGTSGKTWARGRKSRRDKVIRGGLTAA